MKQIKLLQIAYWTGLAVLAVQATCFGKSKETDTMDSSAPSCDESCEIRQADTAFNARAQEIGVPGAFLEFAADDAVMYRNGMDPIIGKAAIAKAMAGEEKVSLVWKPMHCEIAESGELGYSRGSFVLKMPTGEDGKLAEEPIEGFYISIWKKQPDGSWKWVFDSGIISRMPQP